MKKVSVVVVFDNAKLKVLSLTVQHRGGYTSMIRPGGSMRLGENDTLQAMYRQVLDLLKANHMYAGYKELAGTRYYDILWIDSATYHIAQYNYLGDEEND